MTADALYRRAWRGSYPRAVRGRGAWIEDDEGYRWLDAVGGVHVVGIGHGVPEIADAAAAQLRTLAFPYSGSFTTAAEIELAERVAALAPGTAKAFFVAGGSEANEVAFKLARKYQLVRGRPERWRVIARRQSYHGSTMATLSASGHPGRRRDFHPFLLDFPHVSAPYVPPGQAPPPDLGARLAEELERVIRAEGAETIAAFIAEPVGGAASAAVVPPADYFPRVREVCDRHDILLIADEVITGLGRTGRPFGIQHWGVEPDLITCGKGLSSGYAPLGAVLLHGRVWDALVGSGSDSVFTGYTFANHPVSCAIGVAVLDHVQRHGLIERARTEGAWFLDRLRHLLELPSVGDVRGLGMLAGVELVADAASGATWPAEARFVERVVAKARERRLLLHAGRGCRDGVEGEHLLLSPPFVADREELALIVDRLADAIAEAASETGG